MTESWLQLVKELSKVPSLIPEIYGDLLKPGVKQVGKALESIIGIGNTILWPFTLANERARIALERNMEKYRAQIQDVPEEKIIHVAPEIGVPIAEKLTYVSDEQLSDLYINLLSKASTIDTAHFAHPSFVNIINNLSPDEAILLKELHNQPRIPFVKATLAKKGTTHWSLIGDLLTGLETKVKLSFPDNVVAYMSNFEGLGLIDIHRESFMVGDGIYESLEKLYRPELDAMSFDKSTQEIKFIKGRIEVTTFGALFLDACLTRLKDRKGLRDTSHIS
ncbi:MAG: DUF4393 domain-containing protein [Thermodesulfovibrionales bacterium]|nr:DUF4393 domain-containing protein [Thermodesulfovibrionales bacterium]